MMTLLIMAVGLVAGLCLACLIDSAYVEAAPLDQPYRKCSGCKWRRRIGMRSICVHPSVCEKAHGSVPCVKAIVDPELCGLGRDRFESR